MEYEDREKLAGEYARAIIRQLPHQFRASWEEWLVVEQGIKDQVAGAMILAENRAQGN